MTDPGALTQASSGDPGIITAAMNQVVDQARSLGLTWTLRMATVTTDDPLSITYDGDTVPLNATSMIGLLSEGQRVYSIILPPSGNFVVGAVVSNPPRMGCNCGIFYSLASSPTASPTPVPIGGSPKFTFTKYNNLTSIKFDFSGTFFSSGGNAGATFSFEITSGPTSGNIEVASLAGAVTDGVRVCVSGHAMVGTNVVAGDYEFSGYWFRNFGAGLLNTSADDTWFGCATEFLP